MTTHVHPRSPATLPPRRVTMSARSAPPAAATRGDSFRRAALLVWRALEMLGAERAQREMVRAAVLYAPSRPALAAVLRAAAARRPG